MKKKKAKFKQKDGLLTIVIPKNALITKVEIFGNFKNK